MASYTTGPWSLALNVTNLFDKTYVGSCTTGCFYGCLLYTSRCV